MPSKGVSTLDTAPLEAASKKDAYENLLTQLSGLLDKDVNPIANMANFCAVIKQLFDFHWVGIYQVLDGRLVLGPFQGPPACVEIPWGKGVCGKAWEDKKTVIVDNVHDYPGHIACSPYSQSEIVVPIFAKNHSRFAKNQAHAAEGSAELIGVLDIDADSIGAFDTIDSNYLKKAISLLEESLC